MSSGNAQSATLLFTESQDWFSHNIESWTKVFPLVSKQPRVLEIGSWEGRSAVFLLNTLCADGGDIVCIDHFDLFRTDAGKDRHNRMDHNLTTTGKPFRIMSEFSVPALMKLLEEEIDSPNPGFDWIYVDGSHEADDTFLDGELSWRLAREGCIFIFDDYHWDSEPETSIHHPKPGIDGFLALHRGQYERLSAEGDYQVVLRKTSPMRIGFLTPEKMKYGVDEAFAYSINVVFTVDSQYAMPVAVAIRSILEHTMARITIYVVNYGISDDDREKIKSSIPLRENSTLMFLTPPKTGLGTSLGVTWAKLELHQVVPVERILYLDADILVRHDLKALWETDLRGKSIGSVVDVGHPMGHSGIKRGQYFNAGLLLMNLTNIRSSTSQLEAIAASHVQDKYKDQDALNAYFEGDWTPLSLRWNAQGLGTYAKCPSEERASLDLKEMNNPYIIHFTGPVNPKVGDILNPYFQPPPAKPWGYVGAPGHPFQHEWWTVLERTVWGGKGDSFRSPWFEEGRKEAREKALAEGIGEFHRVADSFFRQLQSLSPGESDVN
ncbi:glycosyltransferase family 8 protein [Amanita muscaria Koide BX008]|uniref:Glycosyltransferase family 8 protein n=1 Tax=Amanita muscaria (strain Koide BX008) TaxID=946122 RepID=A0A0C2WN87_AMAMK|nr:glycosyltransferase family 8 protein [Amanita muscaria Koide BX008]